MFAHRPRHHVLFRLTALVFTAGLVLTGCTNDDDATGNASTSEPSSNPTEFIPASEDGPAKNVPEPRMDPLSRKNTEEGMVQAIHDWWAALHYHQLTGNPQLLESRSDKECEMCNGYIEDFRGLYADGMWMQAPAPEIRVFDPSFTPEKTFSTALVEMTSYPGEIYDESGLLEPDIEQEASVGIRKFALEFNEVRNYWIVLEGLPEDYDVDN